MTERKDKTDGTPEWAKRMFSGFASFRFKALLFFVFVGGPLWSAFQLIMAVTSGTVADGFERWVTLEESPTRFWVHVAYSIFFLALPFGIFHLFRKHPEFAQRIVQQIKLSLRV